ncbi:hypothetical protein SAMN05878443_2335 [Carnobacterium alterfunditum]|uniref:Uncharacterized protein n=1 Tax=Carnobacterium alterfunditum TaxID=28230 RepID=A0A1N6IHP5_9LACT|nr:hypothetical protein [Carnobacterium alterfunditum]SIO31557.1 hypothetical protein SAMN05878443_2335 [Carnobacterium alterfunditum]
MIVIDEVLKKEALKRTENRMKYSFREEPISQPGYKYSMILTAVLGELVFEKYLKSKKINYQQIESSDYARYFQIGNLKLETKTSAYYNSKGYNRLNLLYNVREYDYNIDFNIHYVVQMFINGKIPSNKFDIDECTIGHITGGAEFSRIPEISNEVNYDVRRPCYVVDLDDLTKVDDIF